MKWNASATKAADPPALQPKCSEVAVQHKSMEPLAATPTFHPCAVEELELRGISVHYLATVFMDEVRAAGLDCSSSIRDVEAQVVLSRTAAARCRRDGRPGAAYVDLVGGLGSGGPSGNAPSSATAPATHVLSYAGDAAIGDLVDALEQHCKDVGRSSMTTYIWLCCLCRNQHRERQEPESLAGADDEREAPLAPGHASIDAADALREQVLGRMRRVGRVLVLMGPWVGPRHLRRTWCVTETCLALSLGSDSCELTPIVAPAEAAHLADDVLRGGGCAILKAWATLVGLDLEATQTSRPQDKHLLLSLLRARPGGLAAAATAATRHVQMVLATAAESHTRRLLAAGALEGEVAARVCDMLGWLLREVALHHRATAMLQDGLQLSLRAHASAFKVSKPLATVGILSCIGTAKGHGCNQDTALQALEAQRRTHERLSTLETPGGIAVLAAIGAARWTAGDQDGALVALQETRRLRADTHTLDTAEGAILLRNIGVVRWAKGEHERGLEAYSEARQICKRVGCTQTPDGVALFLNIGFAKADRGDAAGALEAYSEARQSFEAHAGAGGLDSPSGATLSPASEWPLATAATKLPRRIRMGRRGACARRPEPWGLPRVRCCCGTSGWPSRRLARQTKPWRPFRRRCSSGGRWARFRRQRVRICWRTLVSRVRRLGTAWVPSRCCARHGAFTSGHARCRRPAARCC